MEVARSARFGAGSWHPPLRPWRLYPETHPVFHKEMRVATYGYLNSNIVPIIYCCLKTSTSIFWCFFDGRLPTSPNKMLAENRSRRLHILSVESIEHFGPGKLESAGRLVMHYRDSASSGYTCYTLYSSIIVLKHYSIYEYKMSCRKVENAKPRAADCCHHGNYRGSIKDYQSLCQVSTCLHREEKNINSRALKSTSGLEFQSVSTWFTCSIQFWLLRASKSSSSSFNMT